MFTYYEEMDVYYGQHCSNINYGGGADNVVYVEATSHTLNVLIC